MAMNTGKAVEELIAYTLINDKMKLVEILRKNGVNVPDDASDDFIIAATLKGNKVSKAFKADLVELLSKQAIENADTFVSFDASEDNNFFKDENYFNTNGLTSLGQNVGTVASAAQTTTIRTSGDKTKTGTFLSGLGSFVKSNVLTQDNINNFISTGLTAINNKSQRKADTAAAEVENIKLQRLQLEASLGSKGSVGSNKTLTYVLVGVGVIIIGVSVYLYVKRKK